MAAGGRFEVALQLLPVCLGGQLLVFQQAALLQDLVLLVNEVGLSGGDGVGCNLGLGGGIGRLLLFHQLDREVENISSTSAVKYV